MAIAKNAPATAKSMAINLYEHQKEAIGKLRSGSILVGGVGSGKSRTALAYYFSIECEGKIKTNEKGGFAPMKKPKDLYIITTARKRDTLEWEEECCHFLLSTKRELCINNVGVFVDSWNNVAKYSNVKNAFFIFDEQRVIGNGTWVKAFLNIAKNNHWLLLSATPGDTWLDYVPVFIANGYYKNRTAFFRRHVVYNNFSKYPKVEKYLEIGYLMKLRSSILVTMNYNKRTISHDKTVNVVFDKNLLDTVLFKRWNVYEQKPIKTISEVCYLMRKVVNSDSSRLFALETLLKSHPKAIVFYNFDYERDLLLQLGANIGIPTAQWNGHKHERIPITDQWMYIVQYAAGAEGWNCIETNTIIFFSQNYSYKATIQAAGRIDRLNTPYIDLFYFYLRSNSVIDLAIQKAFINKRDFNETRFTSV